MEAGEQEQTFPAPIVGWREWWLSDEGELKPLIAYRGSGAWDSSGSPLFEARCPLAEHSPADQGCVCGLYARYDPPSKTFRPNTIWGLVLGAGAVQLHPTGWRAERCQLIGLISPQGRGVIERVFKSAAGRSEKRAELAASRYQAPLWDSADQADLALSGLTPPPVRDIPRPSLKRSTRAVEAFYDLIFYSLVPLASVFFIFLALFTDNNPLIGLAFLAIIVIAGLVSPDPYLRDLLSWLIPRRSRTR